MNVGCSSLLFTSIPSYPSIHSTTNNWRKNVEKCETSKTKSRSNITPGTTLQCSIVELMEFNWLKWRNDFFLWSNLLKISVDGNYTRHLTYGWCRWLTVPVWLTMPARLASWLSTLFHSNFFVYFHSIDLTYSWYLWSCDMIWMLGFIRGLNWFQLKI